MCLIGFNLHFIWLQHRKLLHLLFIINVFLIFTDVSRAPETIWTLLSQLVFLISVYHDATLTHTLPFLPLLGTLLFEVIPTVIFRQIQCTGMSPGTGFSWGGLSKGVPDFDESCKRFPSKPADLFHSLTAVSWENINMLNTELKANLFFLCFYTFYAFLSLA